MILDDFTIGNATKTDELQKTMLKGELAWLSSYFSDSLTCTLIKVSIMHSLVIYTLCHETL